MENKILDRILELSSKLNELLAKREELVHDLKATEKNIDIIYSSIHELKNILNKEDQE